MCIRDRKSIYLIKSRYPELRMNKLVLNEIHDNFKYLFDFSFEKQLSKTHSSKTINIKLPDFYKAINTKKLFSVSRKESKKNSFGHLLENNNHFVPIIARNRKLMVIIE